MELEVPPSTHDVLDGRLQDIDKEKEIELYYELLSSGRSVGEILDSLGGVQRKSEHGNITPASITTTEPPPSGSAGAASEAISEAAPAEATQATARPTPGPSAPLEAESRGSGKARSTGSTPLDKPGPGDRGQLPGEKFPGSVPDTLGSAAAPAAIDGTIAAFSKNQEPRRPEKFSQSAKRIAFAALYTVAVSSVSIAGFALVSGGRNADTTTARIQSDMSGSTEAIAISGSAADRSQAVMTAKPNERNVNADISSASEPSRSAGPGSTASLLQGDAAEMPPTFPTGAADRGQAAQPDRETPASRIDNRHTVGLDAGRSEDVSAPSAKEVGGRKIVRAFYTALENGNGEAASLLVVPEKRQAGPFSASALSGFYGQLEQPFRLIRVDRVGENLYEVAYSYKVRNGRFCNGRSLITTTNRQNQVLIEKIRSPNGC